LRGKRFLKQVIEGKKTGRIEVMGRLEEDVNTYWMSLGKGEDSGK